MHDNDGLRDACRERLEDYLATHGIDCSKPFRCLNPEHEDRHPSMVLDRRNHRAKCFSCGASYDALDVAGIVEGAGTYAERLAAVSRALGMDAPSTAGGGDDRGDGKGDEARKLLSEARTHGLGGAAESYLSMRGFEPSVIEAAGIVSIGSYAAGGGRVWDGALVIPVAEGSVTIRNTGDARDGKDRYRRRGPARVYDPCNALQGTEPRAVFVVEGELDALAVIQAGGSAVAMCSTGNKALFLQAAKGAGGARWIIAMDDDEAGENARAEIERRLDEMGAVHTSFSFDGCGHGCKDAADALEFNPDWLRREVARAAAEAMEAESALEAAYDARTGAQALLTALYGGLAGSDALRPVKTGFAMLDRALGGGLYPGFYVVPGGTGQGKTALALQMAAQAAQTADVLYFSLEMSAAEVLARLVSRETLLIASRDGLPEWQCKSMRGISDASRYAKYDEAEHVLIARAFNDVHAKLERMHFIEGITDMNRKGGRVTAADIAQAVEEHISAKGGAPVVFVDYIQLVAPSDARATDKQAMDEAAVALKRLSVLHRIPVVALSSINRESYGQRITLSSAKESGGLEFTADVALGLQYEGQGGDGWTTATRHAKMDEAAAEDPRKIELVILKNRHGGRGTIYLDYYAKFNHMEEVQFSPRGEKVFGFDTEEIGA